MSLPLRSFFILLSFTIMAILLIFILLFFPSSSSSSSNNTYEHLHERYHRNQIPLIVVPFYYRIQLWIYAPFLPGIDYGDRNFTFDGIVNISLNVYKSTNRILLHIQDLHIQSIHLIDSYGLTINLNYHIQPSLFLLDIRTKRELEFDQIYTLKIMYKGNIMHGTIRGLGIYASSYTHFNHTRYGVFTHLQPDHARKVFPSLDIPSAKAIFETSIIHPNGLTANSNSIEKKTRMIEVDDVQWIETQFEPTPKMSTYIFALSVSSFPYKETRYRDIRIRVYVEPLKIDDIDEIVKVTPLVLKFYEDYFDIPYPLKKLDIFIVDTIAVAAMENWGLIFCRSHGVVFKNSLSHNKLQLTDVISHEIAHQWFGNLVTMKWWTNLWLNEGFASLLGQMASDHIGYKEIRMRQLGGSDLTSALRRDASITSPAVSEREDKPIKPQKFFTAISYFKAQSILRMIQRILSPLLFQKGIQLFLKKYTYSNADAYDLIQTFVRTYEEDKGILTSNNFTLTKVIETWIYQSGHPVVHIFPIPNTTNRYIVSQSPDTSYDARTAKNGSENKLWIIPLFILDNDGRTRTEWLDTKKKEITLGNDLFIDRESHTFIRIRYTVDHYDKIIDLMKKNISAIPFAARIRLIDDAFSFAEWDKMPYSVPFRLVLHNTREDSDISTKLFHAHLEVYRVRMKFRPEFQIIKKFILHVYSPLFDVASSIDNSTSTMSSKLQEIVLFNLCENGHMKCLHFGMDHMKKILLLCNHSLLSDKCNYLPQGVRSSVYLSGGNSKDQEIFEFLLTKFKDETYQDEQERIFKGLMENNQKHNMYKVFDFVINKSRRGTHQINELLLGYVKKHLYENNHYVTYFEDKKDNILSKYSFDIIKVLYHNYIRTAQDSTIEKLGQISREFYESTNETFFIDEYERTIERVQLVTVWSTTNAPHVYSNISMILNGNFP